MKLSRILLGLTLASAMAMGAHGQSLATEATASAVNWNGNWYAGTEQTQSFPVIYFGQQNGNVFSLGAREIVVPGAGWSMYGALGNYSPDISSLIKKTTFNPDQFRLSFDVAGGIATLQNNVAKPAVEGRVNFAYSLTPNTALTGAYAGGGFIGSQRFGVVSAGFQYIFGAGNVQTSAMKRMQSKAAQVRMAKKLSQ